MKDFKVLSKDMEKICVLAISIVLGSILLIPHTPVLAEQVGGSPESGVDSKRHILNDTLASSSHGSVSSGTWGDWGAMWNRIYSASIWTPSSANATTADVTSGKTFYAGLTRTPFTGTYVAAGAIDYSYQSLVEWDDQKGTSGAGDSVWTLTAGSATTGVYKDTRTGLYWSGSQGAHDNIFPNTDHSTCPFFTNRVTYDGLTGACGNAINHCGALSLVAVTGSAANTDWYLPSKNELMQAYLDGLYNKTNTTWRNGYFWTSTEQTWYPNNAWFGDFGVVYLTNAAKVDTSPNVRCVRRD
jgi:hypothetical protein